MSYDELYAGWVCDTCGYQERSSGETMPVYPKIYRSKDSNQRVREAN